MADEPRPDVLAPSILVVAELVAMVGLLATTIRMVETFVALQQ